MVAPDVKVFQAKMTIRPWNKPRLLAGEDPSPGEGALLHPLCVQVWWPSPHSSVPTTCEVHMTGDTRLCIGFISWVSEETNYPGNFRAYN